MVFAPFEPGIAQNPRGGLTENCGAHTPCSATRRARFRVRECSRPMNEILKDASARAIRYLEGVESRSVAPTPAAVEGLKALDEALPAVTSDPAETLRLLDEVVSPATMAMAGLRFFGFVIGDSLPVALGANWLAGAWDQNSALYRATPGTA